MWRGCAVWTILCVLAYTLLVDAYPHHSFPSHHPADHWHELPDVLPPSLPMCWQLYLKHDSKQLSELERTFWEVSDPHHVRYGAHLSLGDVHALTAHPALDTVVAWIKGGIQPITEIAESGESNLWRSDVESVSPPHSVGTLSRYRVISTGDIIKVCTTVQQTEQLFKCKLKKYRHKKDALIGLRSATDLSIPPHVQPSIEFIGGLNTPIHRGLHQRGHHGDNRYRDSYCYRDKYGNDEIMTVKSRKDENFLYYPHRLPTYNITLQPTSPDDDTIIIPPKLLNLTGGHEELSIVWITYCADGQPNQSPAPFPPCHKQGPQLLHFDILLTDSNLHHHRILPVLSDVCNLDQCSTAVPMTNYQGYHVQVRAFYDNGHSATSCLSLQVFGSEFVTPHFLRALYGIPEGLSVKHPNNSVAVSEFTEQYYAQKDLDTYFDLMGIPRSNVTLLVGPNNETEGALTGGESQLDIQVLMGLAPHADIVFWSVAGREPENSQEPFLKWVTDLNDRADIPLVHSVSYGDLELELPLEYMQRLNTEFMKLGSRGVTLIFASGDCGVASDWDYEHDLEGACNMSHPEFPTSSPYVLSVGATQLSTHHAPICDRNWRGVSLGCAPPMEVVCSAELGGVITSGGGFSRHWKRPQYQQQHVQHYISNYADHLPQREHFYARQHRGYPDIAAYGTKYVVIMDGEILPTAGTSASTPTIAAMITLWNDIRLANNQPPLGFINPLLYSLAAHHPEAFHDVVHGNNRCTVNNEPCCAEGFAAAAGWDATSGLGTPKFMEIAQLIMNAGNPFIQHIASKSSFSYLAVAQHPISVQQPVDNNLYIILAFILFLILLLLLFIRAYPSQFIAVLTCGRYTVRPAEQRSTEKPTEHTALLQSMHQHT